MISTTLRISLILVIIVYYALIMRFLKRKVISLKYTLLWILTGVVMGIFVIWPDLLTRLTRIFGIESNMNGLFVFAIGFIVVILMSLTSIVSRQNDKIRSLTQTIAMMEKEVRELKNKNDRLEQFVTEKDGCGGIKL